MRSRICSSIAVIAFMFALAAPGAFAQAQSGTNQNAHHPPAAPMQGGMMGGGGMMQMMPMMQNMMAMMSAETGMMTPHVEGRIAALKAELKITEAQVPQWNRFADALRATAKSMNEMHQSMMAMAPANAAKPLPDRLAAREQSLAAHQAAIKTEREALQVLYGSFSDEQKKIADGLRIGPMGMM